MSEGYKALPEAIEILECKKKRPLSTFEFGFMRGCEYAYERQQAKVEELQKRVDKAIRFLVEAELYQSEPNIDLAVKALKGEG
ncbi:hypothetical protein AYA92_RS02395 [Acinetobacter baumannii]|nr:hypothetical protein [Acinetobacter baumannii]